MTHGGGSIVLWGVFFPPRLCDVLHYLAKDKSNRPRNWRSDVWYMTFTMLISVIRKYRMLPLVATTHIKKKTKQKTYETCYI